jgi:hypothetical protein
MGQKDGNNSMPQKPNALFWTLELGGTPSVFGERKKKNTRIGENEFVFRILLLTILY